MKNLSFIIFSILLILSFSCEYERLPEPDDTSSGGSSSTLQGTGAAAVCDTIDVRYQNTIRPILANNCYDCHSTGNTQGLPDFQNFQSLNTYLTNTTAGGLKGKIFYTYISLGIMPMGANSHPLNSCEIKQIYVWLQNGAPKN